jgi:mannose-1-phosphate guanylyltransferase
LTRTQSTRLDHSNEPAQLVPPMKAFLLAAGHGTRLRPLTDSVPKCLLPVRGVPILQIWLEICRHLGIDQVLVNLHAHADAVRAFRDKESKDINVDVSEEPTLLGSAGTLLANRDWIGSDSLFWIFYADVLTTENLAPMLETHKKRRQIATLGVCEVPDPTRCGIVTVDPDNIVSEFVEKPVTPPGNLAFSGIMVGSPALLDFVPRQVPADIGFHVLPTLAGRMVAYRISSLLLDIGTPENYNAAQAAWPGFSS